MPCGRAAYDSFLILYVVRGKGYCYLDNRRVELHVGSLVILDCYLPQRYGTDSSWEIYWIHFDGRMARDYYEAIAQSRCQVILPRNTYHAVHALGAHLQHVSCRQAHQRGVDFKEHYRRADRATGFRAARGWRAGAQCTF